MWAYESGLKFDRRAASASAALFRMDVSNEQTFNPITRGSSSGGASRHQGVELALRAPMAKSSRSVERRLDVQRRALSQRSTRSRTTTVTRRLSGLRVYNTAKYIGSAALEFAPPGQPWRVRVSGNWVGPYSPFDEPGVVLGAYGLAHASGAWTMRRAEIEPGVRNVFDRAYPEVVAGGLVAPGEPRAVFVTVKVLRRQPPRLQRTVV